MHTTLIALTTAAAGYTLGRFRPWNRMEDWVGRQVYKTWWIGSAPKEVLLTTGPPPAPRLTGAQSCPVSDQPADDLHDVSQGLSDGVAEEEHAASIVESGQWHGHVPGIGRTVTTYE